MPITPLHPVIRITQEEFRELSYGVMACVFEIHKEFGRFFDERIYKHELAARHPGVELEFPIKVAHQGFCTTYYLDALIGGGAFEFKTADSLTTRHRGQLYKYLLLLDVTHGKLVNLRPESVEHEFVNATLRPADRHGFEIDTARWHSGLAGSDLVFHSLIDLLRDWGAGLELALYEAALTCFLGGEPAVLQDVPVRGSAADLGCQTMRMAADGVAFRLTAFDSDNNQFEDHARRLLQHVDLRAILWVNVGIRRVTFTTIQRGSGL
jgi:GxxExxY protein